MRASEFLNEDEPVRIKLNNNDAAKAFIQKVYAKYPHTMQNNHVMVWGSGDDQQFAMFELTPSFSKRGAVEVKWFQAYPLRQGVGSRAMKELQALAREDGISLTLYPWDKGQVSQSRLTKFYKGQGFTPTVKGGKAMKWEPISERKQYPLEDFEGLKFRIVADSGQLFVNALDSTGNNELGHVTFNIDNGKDLDPQDLFIKDKFRGQGIAKIMYDFVKSKGYKIQRSWDQTDAGAGFWNKHKGEDVRVWEQKHVDETELDSTGWGATPQGTDVDYFGLKVKMRPSTFLKLSHPLNAGEQNSDVEKHMQGGGKIAYPFLEIKDPVEWEDGDFSQQGKVVNHEGRNRMTHWIKIKGDEPIQVNIFLRGANRRRYVTDDMIQALSQGLISQTGQLVKNPFDASTALEEAGVQGNRWTGAEEYRHLVELDLEG